MQKVKYFSYLDELKQYNFLSTEGYISYVKNYFGVSDSLAQLIVKEWIEKQNN